MLLPEVRLDQITCFEDMCATKAPLISPAMFREFIAPGYRKYLGGLKDMGVEQLFMDTDGDAWLWDEQEDWNTEAVGEDMQQDAAQINAMQGACFACGMAGHYARDCRKGKRKGTGGGKGKGFGHNLMGGEGF